MKGAYLDKYPGTQLHAMAMFEVFYQKKLKDNENKINIMIVLILAVQVFLNCKKRCSSAIDATRQYIGTTNKNNLILS